MRTLFALMLVLSLSGCAYMNVKTPFDSTLNRTRLGTKVGTADAYSVLWLFAWGDASYARAAKNGHITVMTHSDQEIFDEFFGLYSRWRIVVYGN